MKKVERGKRGIGAENAESTGTGIDQIFLGALRAPGSFCAFRVDSALSAFHFLLVQA